MILQKSIKMYHRNDSTISKYYTMKTSQPTLPEYLPSRWTQIPKDSNISFLPTITDIQDKLLEYEKEYEVVREMIQPEPIRKHLGVNKIDEAYDFVLTKTQNAYTIKPNITQRHFLYRGQNQHFGTCVPAMYRSKIIFLVENIKRAEFEILLESHPLYKLFLHGIPIQNSRSKIRIINPFGLAQHYGFKTALLDLTADFNVAAFFGSSKYIESKNDYILYEDSKNKYGVIYVYHMIHPFNCLSAIDRLSTIGLQSFPRSGNQQGFLWSPSPISKDFEFHPLVTKVFFRHDKSVGKNIHDKMYSYLFPEDELYIKANQIQLSNVFSQNAFDRNLTDNKEDNPYKNMSILFENNITINSSHQVVFTESELELYYKKIQNGFWRDFWDKVFIPNDEKGNIKNDILNLPNDPKFREYFYR